MKLLHVLLAVIALTLPALAAPRGTKVTNRQFPDGTGSSKITDPDKKTAEETFVDAKGRVTHKIVYALDNRLQPISASCYSAKGILNYKSSYKLDGADRIVQEVMSNGQGKLICTKNYIYGTANGQSVLQEIEWYDSKGQRVEMKKKKR